MPISSARLQDAVAFAQAHDSPWPRSMFYPDGAYVGTREWDEKGPWTEIVGPVEPRGGPAGIVLKGGRVAAEWGERLTAVEARADALTGLERV